MEGQVAWFKYNYYLLLLIVTQPGCSLVIALSRRMLTRSGDRKMLRLVTE